MATEAARTTLPRRRGRALAGGVAGRACIG